MAKGYFHKHLQLRQYFINFAMRSDGSRALPSERDLAKMFDVSRDTIRASLATMIQEKYLTRVPRKGYFSNPSCIPLKQIKRKLVGILISSGSNAYLDTDSMQYLSCIFQEAVPHNYLVQILQSTHERLLRDVSNCGLEGLLWLSADTEKGLFEKLSCKVDFPIVALFNYDQPAVGDFIWLDHCQEFFLRTEHLLQCGCKRIASLDFNDRTRQGYCDALQKAGIPFTPELLVKPEDFEKRLPELLNEFHADAFSIRGIQYPLLQKYLDEHGLRVPQDVQIIIDNFKIPDESITRTCKPFKKVVAAMMRLLAARMAGCAGTTTGNEKFTWSIIQGRSTEPLDL